MSFTSLPASLLPKWVISDTHFFQASAVSKGYRPAGYEDELLANWSRLVDPDDIVFHLGDVIFSEASRLGGLIKRMPGRIHLVRGNHDHKSAGWYERKGFAAVHELPVLIDNLLFSHEPIGRLPTGVINIHGHTHGDAHRADELPPGYGPQHIEIALETMGYRPILLDELLASGRPNPHHY
jgi:calcineurin-like phosphoesterase family protein